MQTIEIKFPARRYHATPWDANVNEGRVEWPPCPWRLLRAFIAVGYSKLGWQKELPPIAQSLICKLTSHPPDFHLPKSTAAHTRHYMPVMDGKKERKAKVFDTFLKLASGDSMLVHYNVTLEDDERALLGEIVASLAYLGRAESWVEAELVESKEATAPKTKRISVSIATSGDTTRTRLLASMEADRFATWRQGAVEDAIQHLSDNAEAAGEPLSPKKLKSESKKINQKYPPDIVQALQQTNSDWQKTGWSRPPGSRWVDYQYPDELFERQPLTPLATNRAFKKPTAILLAIDGEGLRGTLRPKMQRALPLMELLHSEAIRYATKELNLGHLPELMGTTVDGKPRRGSHSHAHWLPLSFKGGGKIDHVLVTANEGFSRQAIQAISCIRWAYAKGLNTLSVNMVGQGDLSSIYQQLSASGKISTDTLAVLKPSNTFVSATPMVLRKYLAKHGKKTFAGQVYEELNERGLPAPVSIEIMSNQHMAQNKLKGYLLRRGKKKNQPPHESSWACKLTFDQIVPGPITLGYASHFGLGLFKAEST